MLYPLSYEGELPAYRRFLEGGLSAPRRSYIDSYTVPTRELHPVAPVARVRNLAGAVLKPRECAPEPGAGGLFAAGPNIGLERHHPVALDARDPRRCVAGPVTDPADV